LRNVGEKPKTETKDSSESVPSYLSQRKSRVIEEPKTERKEENPEKPLFAAVNLKRVETKSEPRETKSESPVYSLETSSRRSRVWDSKAEEKIETKAFEPTSRSESNRRTFEEPKTEKKEEIPEKPVFASVSLKKTDPPKETSSESAANTARRTRAFSESTRDNISKRTSDLNGSPEKASFNVSLRKTSNAPADLKGEVSNISKSPLNKEEKKEEPFFGTVSLKKAGDPKPKDSETLKRSVSFSKTRRMGNEEQETRYAEKEESTNESNPFFQKSKTLQKSNSFTRRIKEDS